MNKYSYTYKNTNQIQLICGFNFWKKISILFIINVQYFMLIV